MSKGRRRWTSQLAKSSFPCLSHFVLLGPSVDEMVPGPFCFPQFTNSITNLSRNTL